MIDPAALLDQIVSNYSQADKTDRDTIVRWLCAIRDLRADLAAFAGDVQRDLWPLADERTFTVEGLGETKVRKSISRSNWDNEALTRVVVARALDERVLNEETGEYEAAHEAVARVLSECSRPSWRVTPLRARGITVDEFCSERDDGYSVSLPPRQS